MSFLLVVAICILLGFPALVECSMSLRSRHENATLSAGHGNRQRRKQMEDSSVPDWVRCEGTEGTERTTFFGRERPKCEAQKIQEELLCWEKKGDWYFNDTRQIIDDMSLYIPCEDSISYGINNECAWMLDGTGLKYDWHPKNNCSIQENQYRELEHNMPDFCERMAGERLLLVGDSITKFSNLSWRNKILSSLGLGCPALPARENLNLPPDTFYGCNNLSLYFRENDLLYLGSDQWTDEWYNEIENLNITMLMLNRGSHYRHDSEFVPQVNRTLEGVYNRYPHLKIVWRSSPHGRKDQKNSHMRPPTTRVNGTFPVLYEPDDDSWGYGHFKRQNRLVYDLIKKHYPRILYLDVFNPATTRADSRHDPLHPCVPGFLDTWLEMFYNILVFL